MATCPYCEEPVNLSNIKREEKRDTGFMKQYLYYCPHCLKILGITAP